jgi:predicted secreted protein
LDLVILVGERMVLKVESSMEAFAKSACFFWGAVVAVLIGGSALSSSQEGQIVQGHMKQVTVTEKDNGGGFELNRGDVLTLRLESNPSTGYSWHIVRNDGKLFELMGKPTYEAPEKKSFAGGIEYKIFRFKALTHGKNILELHYKRIWEKEEKPLKTFLITIKIN